MTRLSVIFLILPCLAMAETDLNTLKRTLLTNECKQAVDALRKMTVNPISKTDRLQLINMASEFIAAIDLAKTALNDAIPNIENINTQLYLSTGTKLIGTIAYELQENLYGLPDVLKATLIMNIDKLFALVNSPMPPTIKYDAFTTRQVDLEHDFITFGIIKVRNQASLFDKSCKDLETVMEAGVLKFNETVLALPAGDATVEVLRTTLKDLSIVTARNVFRTGNWLELNPKDVEDTDKVRGVYDQLSQLFNRISVAAESRDISFLKFEFADIFKTGMSKVYKLALVNPDSVGHEEYIRSVIFDGIVIPIAFTDKFKAVLNVP